MAEDLLERLKAEMRYDKITLSYSIEGRDAQGNKKFSLTTLSVSKEGGGGWNTQEATLVKLLLSKKVVAETHRDAMLRGVVDKATCEPETTKIFEVTDRSIQKLLQEQQ